MIGVLFPLLLWGLGFFVTTALYRNMLGPVFLAWTGFLSGATIWLVGSVLLLIFGISYTPVTMSIWVGAILLLAYVIHVRHHSLSLPKTALIPVSTVLALFVGALLVADALHFAYGSPDSFSQLLLAQDLATNQFSDDVRIQLGFWGIFLPSIHSVAFWFGEHFFITFQPAFAFSLVGTLAHLCIISVDASAGKWRWWLPLFITLPFATSYFVIFQAVYVHNSIIAAAYLLPAVVLLWLAHVRADSQILYAGLFFLLGFAFSRTESLLFAAMFLLLCMTYGRFPARVWRLGLLPYTLLLAGWHFWLLLVVQPDTFILSSARVLLLIVVVISTYVGIFVQYVPLFRKHLLSSLAQLFMIAMLIAFAVASLLEAQHMSKNLVSSIDNLLLSGFSWWGLIWHFAFAMPIALPRRQKLPYARILTYGIIGFLLLTLLLGLPRVPYRLGWGDSANRMFTHILPILLFYIYLRLAALLKGNTWCNLTSSQTVSTEVNPTQPHTELRGDLGQ